MELARANEVNFIEPSDTGLFPRHFDCSMAHVQKKFDAPWQLKGTHSALRIHYLSKLFDDETRIEFSRAILEQSRWDGANLPNMF